MDYWNRMPGCLIVKQSSFFDVARKPKINKAVKSIGMSIDGLKNRQFGLILKNWKTKWVYWISYDRKHERVISMVWGDE